MLDEIENGDSIPDNCDPLFLGLINDILPDWEPPTNVDSALDLYVDILDSISELEWGAVVAIGFIYVNIVHRKCVYI